MAFMVSYYRVNYIGMMGGQDLVSNGMGADPRTKHNIAESL